MRVKEIGIIDTSTELTLPLFLARLPLGFPSPGEDYIDQRLDLNKYLVKHPAATYYVRAEGDSMIDEGIRDNDILIVDKSLQAQNNDVVVAALDGLLVVKTLAIPKVGYWRLVPRNPKYNSIVITPDKDFRIWGVVTSYIHEFRRP